MPINLSTKKPKRGLWIKSGAPRKVIDAIFEGEIPRYARNMHYKYRLYPPFDAAYHIAKSARKVGELAEEMDCPELRDLYGFMKTIAYRQLETFEK